MYEWFNLIGPIMFHVFNQSEVSTAFLGYSVHAATPPPQEVRVDNLKMSSYPKLPNSSSFNSKSSNEVPAYSEKPNSPSNHQNSQTKADKMFKSSAWRDLWAALLYYVHLAGVFVILGLNYSNLSKLEHVQTDSAKLVQTLVIIGLTLVLSIVLISIFLMLVKRFPATMIRATFISTIVMLSVMGVGMFFVTNGHFMGLMFLISAGFNIFIYFAWRKRIPFSATLLKCVVDVMNIYPNTWSLSVLAIVGQVLFSALYLTTFAAIGLKYSDASESSGPIRMEGSDVAASLFLVFSMYWSMQIVENVVHTSVCGVFATFYFLHGTGAAIISPVWKSFSRSMTYSFGSIAFGSLIVAAIQFIRFLINSTRNERDNLAAACADCLLGMIEGLVRYFNHYAYVHVAIYGKPFVQSGKDTWELVKSHGVDVIINDSLVGNCMSVAVLLIGLTCAGCAFLGGMMTLDNDSLTITATAFSFLLGLMVAAVATQTIESGVSATLVCYAEDPASLQRSKPELYREIVTSYQQSYF